MFVCVARFLEKISLAASGMTRLLLVFMADVMQDRVYVFYASDHLLSVKIQSIHDGTYVHKTNDGIACASSED